MNQTTRYQANPVVSCGDEEDGAVLYNPDTDTTSIINLTGLIIWSFVATPRTRDEIVDHLCQVYSGVASAQAAADLEKFIDTLSPDFLLEETDAD